MDFSPKAFFAKGPMAQPWSEIASSDLFRAAASAAMLQMQANLGMAQTGVDAAANCYRLEGARTFLAIAMNLTTPPSPAPEKSKRENLDHSL